MAYIWMKVIDCIDMSIILDQHKVILAAMNDKHIGWDSVWRAIISACIT